MTITLLSLRTLFESRLGLGFTATASTDPSTTLLNLLINESIKKIAREEMPWELSNETASYLNQVADSRSVTLPTTLIIPKRVYVKTSGGTWKEMKPKNLDNLIEIENPNSYLKDKTGDPDYYMIRGTDIIFNKVFKNNQTNGVAIYSTERPTALSDDSDTTPLDEYRSLQIVYGACVLFYESEAEDNGQNLAKFMQMYTTETAKLRTYFEPNNQPMMRLDPQVFGYQGVTINNPSVFFTS